MAGHVPYTHDQNYGNVYGGAQEQKAPPSWGFVPASMSTHLPSSATGTNTTPHSYPSTPSHESWPSDFVEAKNPAAEARQQLKKIEKKERRKKQKKKDAKSAVEWLLFLGVFNAVMWTVPCFGTGWQQKMFEGFGVGFTRIRSSLFTIDVVVECHIMDWPFGIDSEKMASLSPTHQVCKIFSHMNGTHSLHKAKDLACTISHHACYIMEVMFYSSFFLVFGYAVSALTSFIASMFLYYYWYVEHLKSIRNWACALFALSPTLGTISFAMYNVAMPDIGELPRSWTAMVQMVNAGTGIGEIKPIGEDVFYNRWGWCWFISYIVILFSLAAPLSWGFWFNRHYDEKQHELDAVNQQIEIENAILDAEERQDNLGWGGGAAASPTSGNAYGYGADGGVGFGAGYGAGYSAGAVNYGGAYGATAAGQYGAGFGPAQQQHLMYSGY